MKEIRKCLFIFFAVSVAIGFAACSDDDDEYLAAEISGDYTASASIAQLEELEPESVSTTVTITKTGTTEAVIAIGPVVINNISIDLGEPVAVSLSGTENIVIIEKRAKTISVAGMPMDGVIAGSVRNGKVLALTAAVDFPEGFTPGFDFPEEAGRLTVVIEGAKIIVEPEPEPEPEPGED